MAGASMQEVLILIVGSLISAFLALGTLMLSDIRRSVKETTEKLTNLEVRVAASYITKEELRDHCAARHAE